MASLSGSAKYVMLQGMQVELPPSLAKVLEVPTGVLDGPGAWFLIESMLAPYRKPQFAYYSDWYLAYPASLAPESSASWYWIVRKAVGVSMSAHGVSLHSAGSFLPAISHELELGRLLPAATLARALFEHLIEAEAFSRKFVAARPADLAVKPWAGDAVESIGRVFLAAHDCLNKGRFDFDLGWSRSQSPKDLKAATDALKSTVGLKTNIMTHIDLIEKRPERTGLRADYERLCDAVHPSFGSREMISAGDARVDGVPVRRQFQAPQAHDANFDEKVGVFLVPIVRQLLLSLTWMASEFVPSLKAVGLLAFDGLEGHDLDELQREEDGDRLHAAVSN